MALLPLGVLDALQYRDMNEMKVGVLRLFFSLSI
jgi:hypothetical protein